MGCVFTGPSSPGETVTFASGPAHSLSPTTSSCHLQCWDIIDTPHVQFDTVNPYNENFRTVVIRNFRYVCTVYTTIVFIHVRVYTVGPYMYTSNHQLVYTWSPGCSNQWADTALHLSSRVDLAYSWRLYRPLTEPPTPSFLPGDPLRGGNGPLTEHLVESPHTPFTVRPQLGTLPAGEATRFVFCFKPEEVGHLLPYRYNMLKSYMCMHKLQRHKVTLHKLCCSRCASRLERLFQVSYLTV